MNAWLNVLRAIVWREFLRFIHQRERFLAALLRPLLWLIVFAAGFRAAIDLPINPPYQTDINYQTYIVPGLCGMVLLFNGMQSSLSLVYDREMGSMRLLLTSPFPRSWLLFCRLLGATSISVAQVYTFLFLAAFVGITMPPLGYVAALPAFFVSGLMLGVLGLLLSSFIHQLENFAGVMNFVIFPMFFLSSALYPLSTTAEGSYFLGLVSYLNPFTHAVELIRFSLYTQFNPMAFGWVVLSSIFLGVIAIRAYDPSRNSIKHKAG